MSTPAPLARAIADLDAVFDHDPPEVALLGAVAPIVAALVARDDWLPAAYATPGQDRYQQYLLHRDLAGRFSVVSFVWGPSQATPVHDHTVWGVVGVLRGAELSQRYATGGDRPPAPLGAPARLEAGAVETLSSTEGDAHRVSNAADGVSVSIHVYGGDIGAVRRSVYPDAGGRTPFVSGYANTDATPPFEAAA